MTFSTPVTPTLDSETPMEGRWDWTSGDAVGTWATGGGYWAPPAGCPNDEVSCYHSAGRLEASELSLIATNVAASFTSQDRRIR
jgi:hypothetical protein